MDDFRKQAEQAKLARMQGIKLTNPGAINAPKKNRIEEALGGRAISNQDQIPNLQKKPEPEPAVYRGDASVLPNKAEKSGSRYGRFLLRFFLGLGVIVLLGAVALGGYGVFHRSQTLSTSDVLARVGQLVELPAGETPTVATVTDLKPLAGEAFFKDAQVGDKVLIYATSSKAILYRPATNKVINVASLNQEQQPGQ